MDHVGLEQPEGVPTSKQAPPRMLRLRLFAAADRCVDRIVRFLKIVHEGVWLGSLSPDELNQVTAENFDQSQFYSSKDHNRSGFFEWEQEMLDRFFRRGSRVLVAGAGGGREVLALRKSGFEAEGFECSMPLIEASRRIFDEQGESSYLIHCPPDCVPAGPAVYDALIIGWTVYTHIPTRTRRILFLEAIRKRALQRAPILISFFVRSSLSGDDAMVYRISRWCSFLSLPRKGTSEVGDHIRFGRYVHSFTQDEVSEELRAAGFRVAHFAESGDLGYAVGIAEDAQRS